MALLVVTVAPTAERTEVPFRNVALDASLVSVQEACFFVKAGVHVCRFDDGLGCAEWVPRGIVEHEQAAGALRAA